MRNHRSVPGLHHRSVVWRLAPFLATTVLLASSACPRGGGAAHGNIVLVTIESLRADRLTGPVQAPDPLRNIRALAGAEGVTAVLASSSETLPSLASILTGAGPVRHGVLVEGLDRLPDGVPTLASSFAAAGYRTAGFASLARLGLSSGLSRGFQAYGWAPSDLVGPSPLVQTDGSGWRTDGRRPGQVTAADALRWAKQHRADPMFIWIHLSEAAPPYATDRALADTFQGNNYDAAMAYEDGVVKSIVDGFTELGLADTTTFVVAGDHGESLGQHGESFHGLNLYRPALETAIAVIPPKGSTNAAALHRTGAGPARLEDLPAMILAWAGLEAPDGSAGRSRAMLPAGPISPDHPLLAVTLAPRSAFGWEGRIALIDGTWVWSGPSDEELYRLDAEPTEGAGAGTTPPDPSRRQAMRTRALAEAAPIAKRLPGRTGLPPAPERARVLELMRSANAASEANDQARVTSDLKQAWQIDPGNFQTAVWLAHVNGAKAVAENTALLREVQTRGSGLPEAALTASRIMGVTPAIGDPLETMKDACAAGGAGCAVELALRLARAGKLEDAAQTLQPIAETGRDPDLWRTLGDLYLAVENTYRAQQAFDKAAALRPDDPDVLLRQGDCLVALRDFDGATAKYEAARRAVPELPIVEIRLGALAHRKGDREGALAHFRKGLGADTNTAAGALALGKLLTEQGLHAEAVTLFHDAAARDTHSAEPYYLAAEALASDNKIDAAEQDLRSALERDPNHVTALYQLARLLVFKGDRVAAGQMLERLAARANMETAVTALRDPLFKTDAPGAPLAKGMQALYAVVKAANPEGGVIVVPGDGLPAPKPTPGAPGPRAPRPPPGSRP